MRELLVHRDFRLLLAAQTLSMAGDWTLLLVFGIWARALTGSDSVAALMIFAMAAPALLAPIGAVLVDRLPRRATVAAVSGTSAAVLMLLWLVRGPEQVWLLAAVAVWSGFSGVVLNAGVSALLQDMLPTPLLGRANGVLATVRQGLRLGAPLLGAGLFVAAGGAVVATVDAATFLLSAVLILALSRPKRTRAVEEAGLPAQLTAGLRHLLRTPMLRRFTVMAVLLYSGFGLVDAAIFPLVGALRQPPSFISVLLTVQGAAAVLSGACTTGLTSRARPELLAAVGAALATLGLALLAATSLPFAFAGFVLLGLAQPPLAIGTSTALQLRTPGHLMGRVSAGFDAAGAVSYTGMIGIGALLILAAPVPAILAGAATGCCAATVAACRAARRRTDATAPVAVEPVAFVPTRLSTGSSSG